MQDHDLSVQVLLKVKQVKHIIAHEFLSIRTQLIGQALFYITNSINF